MSKQFALATWKCDKCNYIKRFETNLSMTNEEITKVANQVLKELHVCQCGIVYEFNNGIAEIINV